MNDQRDTPDNTSDNTSSDPWEDEMASEFDRRVRDLHEAPLTLDLVKGKAMNIQRRRRAAVAGGILAAAAVIVPVAVVTTGSSSDDADGIDPADTPSAVATDPATPSLSADPTTPTTPATPATSGLGFAYLEHVGADTVLYTVGGTEVTLPGDYSDAAVLGDQVAAYRIDDEDDSVVDLIQDGDVVQTYDVRSQMATTPDGRTIAFVTTDDELVFLNADQGEQSFGQVEPDVTLSAIIGDGDCGLESGCHPFLEKQDFTEAFEINYEGPNTAPAPGALRVNDADDDFLVSVVTEGENFQYCSGLYDRREASWLFQTCEYDVREISPTGDYVIGLPAGTDGLGPRRFDILDSDGQPVAAKVMDQGAVQDIVWLDDTHVAALVYEEDQTWRIIRLGVDGDEEVLVEGASGDEIDSPYRLTGQS